MSVGSLPMRKRSCSVIAWASVASLLVMEPSPRPVSPWFVRTLQKTQLRLPVLTTMGLTPVILRLSERALAGRLGQGLPRRRRRQEPGRAAQDTAKQAPAIHLA